MTNVRPLQRFNVASKRFNFCNFFNVVTLLHVVREDGSGITPGAEAAVDQSAVAVQSGFLFNQGAHF